MLRDEIKNLSRETEAERIKIMLEMIPDDHVYSNYFTPMIVMHEQGKEHMWNTLEEMKEASRAKEKSMWRIQNKREEQIKEVRYALHDHVLINTKFLQRRTAAILTRQANQTTRQKTAELMARHRAKASSDFDDEKELKEMIEIFQQQSEEIMELKALLVRYVMKGIAVDPTTGKKDLRARPSIAELTRPKSTRARLRSSHIGRQQAPVTVQTVERLGGGATQRRPATSQIQLRL